MKDKQVGGRKNQSEQAIVDRFRCFQVLPANVRIRKLFHVEQSRKWHANCATTKLREHFAILGFNRHFDAVIAGAASNTTAKVPPTPL